LYSFPSIPPFSEFYFYQLLILLYGSVPHEWFCLSLPGWHGESVVFRNN
jgi:hypothetical protein